MPKCPTCHIPLCNIVYEGLAIRVCPDCRGALVDDQRFRLIQKRREKKWSDEDRARLATEVAAGDRTQERLCPRCQNVMKNFVAFKGEVTLHLDRCPACDSVWFDPGELELAQVLYEKEMDGRTPEDWARIEKQAAAETLLKQKVAEEEDAVAGDVNGLAGGMTGGAMVGGVPVAPAGAVLKVAAMTARWACEEFTEGLDDSGRGRVGHFLTAAVALVILVVLLAGALWVEGCFSQARHWSPHGVTLRP